MRLAAPGRWENNIKHNNTNGQTNASTNLPPEPIYTRTTNSSNALSISKETRATIYDASSRALAERRGVLTPHPFKDAFNPVCGPVPEHHHTHTLYRISLSHPVSRLSNQISIQDVSVTLSQRYVFLDPRSYNSVLTFVIGQDMFGCTVM